MESLIWLTLCDGNRLVTSAFPAHYNAVIMGMIASQITSLTIVFSYLDADQRKHQSFASLAFLRGIPRGPVNSPHKWPVTRKMFPFDVVIMHKEPAMLRCGDFVIVRTKSHIELIWDALTPIWRHFNDTSWYMHLRLVDFIHFCQHYRCEVRISPITEKPRWVGDFSRLCSNHSQVNMVVSDGRQYLQYSRWWMPVDAYQECRHVMCSFACGTCRLVPEFMFWVTDFRRKYQHRKHATNSDSHELPMRYDMGCSRGWYIVRPLGPFTNMD